jgi:hypothetical protein
VGAKEVSACSASAARFSYALVVHTYSGRRSSKPKGHSGVRIIITNMIPPLPQVASVLEQLYDGSTMVKKNELLASGC